MKNRSSRAILLASAGLALSLSLSGVRAADIVWDGDGDGVTFDLDTNWAGNVLPNGTVPDAAVFNGTAAGNLNLNLAGSGFGNTLGLNLRLDAGQTSAVTIDSGANTNALRLNAITIAAGAGPLTLGNGQNTFNITLGSAGGQTHVWTNQSTNAATVASDVRFGMGGAGNHLLHFTGSGNWAVNALLTPSNTANLAIQKTGTGELTLSGGGTLTAFGTSTLGNTAFGGLLHGGTTRITSGSYVGGTNTEWVVGGTDLAGVNTQFIMDGGSLSNMNWVAVARGNGTGTVTSSMTLNNGASLASNNFSAGFNGGNASTAPRASITLNQSAVMTVTTNVYLAESNNSNVTFNINDSATFSQTSTSGGETRLGISNGSIATLNVNGGNANFERDLILGQGGTGTGRLVMNGGTVRVGVLNERWLIIGRNDGASGQIEVNSGSLILANGTDIRFSTTATSAGTSSVTLNGGTITGSVAATQSSLLDLKNGSSTSGTVNNTFNLNGGTLTIAQVLTTNNSGTATFNFNGGTLRPLANHANFLDLGGANQKVYVKDGGAIIDTNGFNVTVVDPLLAGGTGGLTKSGAGTLTLAAAATYTGATQINAGTLALGTSNLASSTVTVATGAALSGNATLAGSLSSNGQLIPATLGTAGTLTIGNGLTLTGGSLNLDLNGSNNTTGGGVNDLLAVTGDLTASGTVIVSPAFSTTPAANTAYTIATYTGTLTGASSLIGGSRAVAIDTATAGLVNLVYTGAAAGNLKWNSTTSSAWDVLTSTNWLNSDTNAPDRYYQADHVSFDDSAGLQTSVVFETTVLPGSVLVDSSSAGNNYAFTGTGGLAGTASLVKSGTSTLTLNTANSHAGGTTLNDGAIVLGNASALGSGTATLNGGSLNVNNLAIANNLSLNGGSITGAGTLNGTVSGTGSLTKSDASILSLTGTNTYAGGTTISAGTIGMARANGDNTNLGSGTVTINTGGTLRVGYQVTSNQNVSGTANAMILNGGTLFAEDGNQHLTGTLTVTANGGSLGSTYNAGTNSAWERDKGLALDGVVSGAGNLTIQHSRISVGNTWNTSYVAFSNNANTYAGTITLNQNTTANEGGVYLGVNGATALANAAIVINDNIVGTNRRFGNSPVVFKNGIASVTLGSIAGNADLVLTGYDPVNHVYTSDNIALTVGGNDTDTTFGGRISGAGSLTKSGTGSMTLTNTSSYTGTTTVSSGQLVINGNISTSPLTTVNNGATLSGNGSTGALTVANGGTLSPGNSPGILNTGNATLEVGATLLIELNGNTVGTEYDQLNVNGTVTLAGTLNVLLNHTPVDGTMFFIIANDGTDAISGTFSGLADGDSFLAGGSQFKISYQADSLGNTFTGGNDVALMAIPEASTALLLALSALGLATRRQRA